MKLTNSLLIKVQSISKLITDRQKTDESDNTPQKKPSLQQKRTLNSFQKIKQIQPPKVQLNHGFSPNQGNLKEFRL